MENIVFFQNKSKQLQMILLCSVLLIASIICIIAGYGIGIFGIIIFSGFIIDIVFQLIRRKPILIIDDKGINITSGVGEISWDEIESFQADSRIGNECISVKLKDYEKLESRLQPSVIKILKTNRKLGHEPVLIPLKLADADANEVSKVLKERLQAYQIQKSEVENNL